MKNFFTPYIYIAFFIFSLQGIFAQEFKLNITSKDSLSRTVLKQIDFAEKHNTELELKNEIQIISNQLKRKGYFTNTYSYTKKDTTYTAFYNLGPKILGLTITSTNKDLQLNIKDSTHIPVIQIEEFLNRLKSEEERKGNVFSEISLNNITIKDSVLYADINITNSESRKVDLIKVKGYDDFPKKYVDQFFKLPNNTYSNQQLSLVSKLTKSLNFVEEAKKPETLFLKDSTIIFIYLKKKKSSSFDGIINFINNENSDKLSFNGQIDLKLNNLLNTGEQFSFYWNRVAEENSELNIKTDIPYIFNSKFNIQSSLNIYRLDSTFINTEFKNSITYNIKPNFNTSIHFYNFESNNQNSTTDSIQDFNKHFLGTGIQFSLYSNNNLFNKQLELISSIQFGKRNSDNLKTQQQQFSLDIFFNQKINNRSYINLKSFTKYLNSNEVFFNELYRIGGANSIRGFNEQSIFTNKYSILKLEYRYLTSENSFLYSISDIGFHNKFRNNNLTTSQGYGFGYQFTIKNNSVNIGLATGINSQQQFSLDTAQLILKWRSLF